MTTKPATKSKPQISSDRATARVRKSHLFLALETICASRNDAMTPTLKRIGRCAMRKLIRSNGKRRE